MTTFVALFVHHNGRKSGLKPPYLARLGLDPSGGITREFAPSLGKKNSRCFHIHTSPGEIFEARRCRWDGKQYVGGSVWFGIQNDGSAFALSRDEAMASLTSPPMKRAEALANLMAASPDFSRMSFSDIVAAEAEPAASS